MKKISELGLELIQLEDQVLLVKGDWQEIPYIKNVIDDKVYMIAKEKIALEILSVPVKNCPQIIASTKPLKGLPLLVIEDEAMSNALNLIEESKIETESTKLILIGAYTTGYNKAKETYKFTEEDLKLAFEFGKHWALNYHEDYLDYIFGVKGCSKLNDQQANQAFADSRLKKELWIEVDGCSDCHLNDGYMSSPNCCREVQPKITNNKIKAVWK